MTWKEIIDYYGTEMEEYISMWSDALRINKSTPTNKHRPNDFKHWIDRLKTVNGIILITHFII